MPITQLIYASRPFGDDPEQVEDILRFARVRNPSLGLTGALVSRSDLYMQMLEGPRMAVSDTFGRILQDDRHIEVALIHCGQAETRLFPDWSMRGVPMTGWMWTPEQVAAGAARDASPEEARAVFARLAAEGR